MKTVNLSSSKSFELDLYLAKQPDFTKMKRIRKTKPKKE